MYTTGNVTQQLRCYSADVETVTQPNENDKKVVTSGLWLNDKIIDAVNNLVAQHLVANSLGDLKCTIA